MGLKGVFQAAGKVAFNVAGDVKRSCTYRSITKSGLSAISRELFTVNVIFADFNTLEQATNGNVQPGDTQAVVLVADMLAIPKAGDQLVDGSDEYTVLSYTSDPAQVTYTIHVRKA